MSVSLDGFVETASRSLDWVRVDEELHAVFHDEARAMGTFLYGRRVDWNSRLVRDDAVAEVTRLKAQAGFDMDVGGPTLASTLVRAGLVDEYRVFVHPVILGAGTPFFPALDERIGLTLLETRIFGSGVVFLRYGVSGPAP